MKTSFWSRLFRRSRQAAVSSQVDDSTGWTSLTGRGQDYDVAELQALYSDALTAWRKNPIAWRIIAITSDYVVGDRISLSSRNPSLNRFCRLFWNHPENHIDMRMESMCDELSRSGDLFIVLFRNPTDGMSYIRFITKDQIIRIITSDQDWETEIEYHERLSDGSIRIWYGPNSPNSAAATSIMLHYSVNRPLGALLGESDLTTMLPWLQRYSRMLEDRVRLHWAIRSFLWLVTVPANKIAEKREQYRVPPDSGSVLIKDSSEIWEAATPQVRAADAAHDMQAVRGMIDAGSGYPPHWRGEAADANLATATAMQAPTERHLRRRQKYFTFILEDLVFQAYVRASQIGMTRPISSNDYSKLFIATLPDVSRSDNEALARAARDISTTMQTLLSQLPGKSLTATKLALEMVYKFAGEPLTPEQINQIVIESQSNERSTE